MTPRLLLHSSAFLIVLIALEPGCQSGNQPMQDIEQHAHTNRLIDETSPYLLQHAHNPVDWYPWGPEALNKAKEENKLILVSIGYSSCHWCHVMEHESFEDTTVASLMNERYVCIKVDREERPDIDQIYMSAVQLMTGRGGWPLNCFALPDGRPVYGGTYFPKDQWTQILNDLSETYTREPQQVEGYAEKLTTGVQQSELVHLNTEPAAFDQSQLDLLVEKWSSSFDVRDGGPNRAPKFPIPNNYEFLLKHGVSRNDKAVLDHVMLTLDKMALGGIYDQIGGGFARYSTDMLWKVPHFEKMLYDNAQLIGLYSQAFQVNGKELYQQRVEETIEFVERELMSEDGAFYSALDADSEGEEGKFYVFTKQELDSLLGEDLELASKLYNVNRKGLWEHGNYILLRTEDDEDFIKKEGMERAAFDEAKNRITAKLMEARSRRTRPGLDDKSLVSWNALMVSGLSKAYAAFGRNEWLELAERNLSLILTKCKRADGGLNHNYKTGKSSINGYLEDYAFLTEALIDVYEVTFNEEYLNEALGLTEYAVTHFLDEQSGMFYFTSDIDPPLIARKHEITDNVIPASNSSMAKNLFRLGHLYFNEDFLKMSERMLNNVQPDMESYPPGYSNWAILMMGYTQSFHEIAITGTQALAKRAEFGRHFIPNRVFLGGSAGSLPLLDGKFFDETTIFVCQNRTCQLPVSSVDEALGQLQ
jgi:uncharacterized protein YyaL (SSP411 family)